MIKAIETEYKGYRFRSRLEARWAVFFDAAGIRYEYEPEGFEAEGVKYLPDFYLPDFDTYAEVKGDKPEAEEEIEKCKGVIEWGGKIRRIIILSTIPGPCDGGMWHFPVLYYDGKDDEVSWGWWFFAGAEKGEVYGKISYSAYCSPVSRFTDWKGKTHLFIAGKETEMFSVAARSDKELRATSYPYSLGKRITEEDIEAQLCGNGAVFYAFEKARQARFEHGEMP